MTAPPIECHWCRREVPANEAVCVPFLEGTPLRVVHTFCADCGKVREERKAMIGRVRT